MSDGAPIVVVGAGLAGLVAAEALARAGRRVVLLEGSPKAGGRCRSYRDDRLGRIIDNGNHLILSANAAVLRWAERIGGRGALEVGESHFPFVDLLDGERWTLEIGLLGALGRAARPPGSSLPGLVRDAARMMAPRGRTVAEVVRDRGAAWRGFWDPMTRAVLNEDPARADAGLLRTVLLRAFAGGGSGARPVLAPKGLGAALVEPAVVHLATMGVRPRYRSAVRGLVMQRGRVAGVETRDGVVRASGVVLALPASATAALLPDLALPGGGPSIANAHFRVPGADLPPLVAVLGGASQWLFRRGDVVSVTVSAAERSPIEGMGRDDALAMLWGEVRHVLRLHGHDAPDAMPPARFLREKAATFDQSPGGVARRPAVDAGPPGLALAGDWTDTGLPATLEGAVLSGERAAAVLA